MGTFSAVHWAIALALLAGLGYFTYLIGSLLWAGAKASGSKWKLWVVALLLPVALLAGLAMIGAAKTPTTQAPAQGPWLEYQRQ